MIATWKTEIAGVEGVETVAVEAMASRKTERAVVEPIARKKIEAVVAGSAATWGDERSVVAPVRAENAKGEPLAASFLRHNSCK